MPTTAGTGSLAMSNASVMPVGGVHVALVANSWNVTTIVFAVDVVTLGVECDNPVAVVWPFSTLIGAAVSTPEKLRMPPATASGPVSVHVYDDGSPAPATLR